MEKENIHQTQILKKFKHNEKLKYNQIYDKQLSSTSHFDYHLKKLITDKIIIKVNEIYKLTPFGYQFISEIDGTYIKIKQKPFICAFLLGIRENNEFVLNIRAKQPFLNFYNIPGGKVELGETTKQCAIREFKEETNLNCENVKLKAIIEKLTYNENNKLIHHMIGYFYTSKKTTGTLDTQNKEGENVWIDLEKLKTKLKFPELDYIITKFLEDDNEILIQEIIRNKDKNTNMTFKIN
jgi:8-oxo-dGTP diphosphatase